MLLLQATGLVSSGNLLVFDIIGSKAHEIIVAIGNKESCQHHSTCDSGVTAETS